jgi:hypothetical protein
MREGADKARSDIQHLQAELEEAQSRFKRFDGAATALEAVHPDLREQAPREEHMTPRILDFTSVDDAPMSTKDAVRDFLGRYPGQWFLTGDVNKNLVDSGLVKGTYEETENRVRVAMIRLAKGENAELETKKGPGRALFYRIKEKGTA